MRAQQREEELDRPRIRRASRLNGVLFGAISGLAFGLTAWGIDAIALASASADRPWVKLAVGLVIAVVIGCIAGWLTAVVDRAAAGLILWACAGIALSWFVGHLPFEGQSTLLKLIEPRLGDVDIYPFVESARVRTAFLMFVVGGLSAMAGTVELVLLDRAKEAQTGTGRAFSLALTIPFFVLAGIASDGIINRPLRDPLVAVDQVIGWAIDAKTTPVDPGLARQRHLGAVKGIENLLDRPYRVSLGAYDSASLFSFSVEVDFDGTWVRCSVLASAPGYCRETDTLYTQALACLIGAGQSCDVSTADAVRPWIEQSIDRKLPPASIGVLGHYASAVLVEVTWPGGEHDLCLFRGVQPIVLSHCTPEADT